MRRQATRRVVTNKMLVAPVGGLNGINALADMPPTDAITLTNWFPRVSDVITRQGYTSQATGMTGAVETLMAYRTSTQKLFAIASGSVYDVTSVGAVGAAVVTGRANSRWQYVNFGTPGGRFLYAVNGADYPLLYDGTTWLNVGTGTGAVISTITFVGTTATVTTATPHGLVNGSTVTVTVTGAAPAPYNVTAVPINVLSSTTFTYTMGSTPATNATTPGAFTYTPGIAGVDPRLLINCDAINSRMWFVEKNSTRAWYLPLNSISGTAQSLDFASLAKLGGNLAGVFGWTQASAFGLQNSNLTVFVTTEGEVFVYSGYDPTNAATWSLAARGRIGAPAGNRFWLRLGTDVVIVSRDGVVNLSKALQIDRFTESTSSSYKIINLISTDMSAYNLNFGWQLQQYPLGGMLIVNVPETENGIAHQYIMNTINGAWARYTGLNANCFDYISDKLYFGGNNGTVYRAETGYADNGNPITSIAQQAFTFLDDPGSPKRFTALRPITKTATNAVLTMDLSVDFDARTPTSQPSLGVAGAPLLWPFVWGSAWSNTIINSRRLQYASGVGYAASVTATAVTNGAPLSWQATDVLYERGSGF